MKKLILLTAAAVTLQLSVQAEARTRLTKAEVQKIFIGKPWRGPRGTFHFRTNGTYTYSERRLTGTKTGGPWSYRIDPKGTIRGNTTHYRFFRTKRGGYEYYHTRSGRYWKARP